MVTAAEVVDIELEPMPKGRQLLRTVVGVVGALLDRIRADAGSMPLEAFLAHWGMTTPGTD